ARRSRSEADIWLRVAKMGHPGEWRAGPCLLTDPAGLTRLTGNPSGRPGLSTDSRPTRLAESKGDSSEPTLSRANPTARLQLRPEKLGPVRRPDIVDRSKYRAVLAARHAIWRQRYNDLRPAEPAEPGADASGYR